MSDIEQQRRALPPDGMLQSAGGQIPNLTPAQYDQAHYSDEFAADVLPIIDAHKGYFTAYDIKQKPIWLEKLVDLGIITIHKSTRHDGHYYKPVPGLTRAFCLTALALRDERRKRMAERAKDGAGS